ncbi:hypothetical protein MBVR141_0670 [Mycoplasmopsis bovirhinis]|uniref:hypothetical protein n=1 Tax=Mycoplasmopsis bovirhinis TaxID=29553 RepID=UPI000BB9C9C5|nr:hypothetical protein [Mycoplasmopsis bovirhinis]BBA22442.1 hypothetical protein MBVR141_0670 [Mycoplasmopsis bovirhinis]
MKKKFNFRLLFLSSLVLPVAVSASCTSQSRVENSINDLNNYLKTLEAQNEPRYKYYLPILKYKISSLNGFLETQKEQGYYFSEAQWNNLNAQIKANKLFYDQIKAQLDLLTETDLNDPNKGIKSEKFLDLYFIMHGLNEPEFSSFREFVKQYGILNWWLNYSKAKIISEYLETIPLAIDESLAKDLSNYYRTTDKIYNSYLIYKFEDPSNEIRKIEKFANDYESLAKERLKTLKNLNSETYQNSLENFELLLSKQKELVKSFNSEYSKYLEIINLVKKSYFDTLQINSILKSEVYESWLKSFEKQIPVVIIWIQETLKYHTKFSIYNQTSFKNSFKNFLTQEEFNNLIDEQKSQRENFNKLENIMQNLVKITQDLNIYKEQIKQFTENNKGG